MYRAFESYLTIYFEKQKNKSDAHNTVVCTLVFDGNIG